MALAAKGHEVTTVDNYLRRRMAMETRSEALMPNPNLEDRAAIYEAVGGRPMRVEIGDCTDYRFVSNLFRDVQPEIVLHYAEQPSAPYSMRGYEEAHLTLKNNLEVTHNIIWAVLQYAPDSHLIKLGTMGEYGTPNIDIEEGWLDIEHKGRKDRFLYPRQAGSLYHTTKVLDTDLLWFYVRTHGMRVTDLMQGPVYGLATPETEMDERLLPNFHYDDIFGTVVNRFLVQAVAGIPLTVYGKGGQERGYLNVNETIQCIELSMANPAEPGELRINNQFVETFTVNELADKVQRVGNSMGLDVQVKSIENPRKEAEDHYYNPVHSNLMEMGLKPHYMTDEVLHDLLERVIQYKGNIDLNRIMPRVKWS